MLLFLIVPSYIVSQLSIVGEGRHFHANVFFIIQLFLFIEAVKRKSIALYLLLAIVLGFAVFYYPANLFTVAVTFLMLVIVIAIDRKARIAHIIGMIMLLCSVYFAGRYLDFGVEPFSAFRTVCFHSPKSLSLPDIYSVRLLITAVLNTAVIFFSQGTYNTVSVVALSGLPWAFVVTYGWGAIAVGCAFMVAIASYAVLLFSVQRSKNNDRFMPLLINYYLVFYVVLFYGLYACNSAHLNDPKYLLFMYAPLLLIFSQALAYLYTKSKLIGIICIVSLLLNNLNVLAHEISSFDFNNIHEHSTYYYQEKCTIEMLHAKSKNMLLNMYETWPPCAAYTLGGHFYRTGKIGLLSMLPEEGDKQQLCYQGFAAAYMQDKEKSNHDVVLMIPTLKEEFLDAWYRGVGNGVIFSLWKKNDFNFDEFIVSRLQNDCITIQNVAKKVPDRFKQQFFSGIGEAIARLYVRPYVPKLQYVTSIEDKIRQYATDYSIAEYKDAMIEGFNRDIVWEKY
jgi:hypothetical protein